MASALVGAAMALLIGLALLSPGGVSGMLLYMAGHGLAKAALFMVAGILLAVCGGIGEIGLRGQGARVWPAGIAMAAGGLLLAGLPAGMMDGGFGRIAAAAAEGQGWLWLPLAACAAGTGAAVLRGAGRIFLGWGPVPGEEDRSPTDEEREKDDRPLWLMLLPALALLAGSCVDAGAAGRIASSAAAALMPPGAADGPASSQPAESATLLAWLSVGLALLLAACQLSWRHLPGLLVRIAQRVLDPLSAGLRFLHDGAVGDDIAWVVVGLALLTAAFGLS